MSKTFIAISRDHSASMSGITRAAMVDYNSTLTSILAGAAADTSQVLLSTVLCGWSRHYNPSKYASSVQVELANVPAGNVKPLTSYSAPGGDTPLIDSTMQAIDTILEGNPTDEDRCIVMITTDGGENSSRTSSTALANRIKSLQATGMWTFIARVPKGQADRVARLGFAPGNILEWVTTSSGQAAAQASTSTAMTNLVASGARSTSTFFANLQDVTVADVKANLVDISSEVQWLTVNPADAGRQIREFVEDKTGAPLLKGAAHYRLVKTEPKVQDNKRIIIRDKASGAVYEGAAARQMLALPTVGTVRLAPDELGNFEVYIQSTSVNRKVDAGTRILYRTNVGVKFKEGPSAR